MVVIAAASLALLVSACGDDGGNDDGNDEAEDTAGEDGGSADWTFGPIYGVNNNDDDDLDGKRDWLTPPFDADTDLMPLTITADQVAGFSDGDSVRLTLSGDADLMRMWHNGAHVLGSGAAEPILEYTFTPGGEETLWVEFGEFLARGSVVIDHLSGGEVVESDTIELVSSPAIMNHHILPAEHLWIVQTSDNAEYVMDYLEALTSDVSLVQGVMYQQDRWIQDEIEFATSTDSAGGRLDTVIDSIRDRGLDNFPEDEFGPQTDWFIGTWGNPTNATTFDAFGNLDASPPAPGYPFGRIYYGLENGVGLDSALATFLDEQTLQAPFPLDSVWLCVGHVDEFSTFIPDPSAPKGYRLLLANTDLGFELLDSIDPGHVINRYDSPYGYGTAGAVAADGALRAYNQDIQNNELNGIREAFKTALDLSEEEIIDIPQIFVQEGNCGAGAMTTGTVNLIVANIDGKGTKLMVPDPFFRNDAEGPESDPWAQDFEARMPDGLDVVWTDDWFSYHLLLGEVHCGTNVTRTPQADWTVDGAELLGLEGAN